MQKPIVFWSNIFAFCFSGLLLAILVLRIPNAVVADSESYKVELMRRIKNEQDIAVLKQLCGLKVSYLLTSNEIGRNLLYGSLGVTILNLGFFALNCLALRSKQKTADH